MVECDLAKVEVAGSNPVSRSNLDYVALGDAPVETVTERNHALRYVGPVAHSAPRVSDLVDSAGRSAMCFRFQASPLRLASVKLGERCCSSC